jgi:hypothetical protein
MAKPALGRGWGLQGGSPVDTSSLRKTVCFCIDICPLIASIAASEAKRRIDFSSLAQRWLFASTGNSAFPPAWLLAIIFGSMQATRCANVLFSTLASDGGYNVSTSASITGVSSGFGYQAHADLFTPTVSGLLTSVELAVHYLRNNPSPSDMVDVSVVLNRVDPVYGNLPSTTILAFGTVTAATQFGMPDLTTFTPSGATALTAGTPYWLVVQPHFTTTGCVWNINSIGAIGARAASFNGSTWGQNPSDTMDAFRINANPVPEPGSTELLIGGLAVLIFLRRAVSPV